jgi:hypothetical protein
MDRSIPKAMAPATKDFTPPSTRQGSPSPSPLRAKKNHTQLTLDSWKTVNALRQGQCVDLDGESLDIASLVAVAKYVLLFFILTLP